MMPLRRWTVAELTLCTIGVIFGIFGAVRTGSIILAVGSATFSLDRSLRNRHRPANERRPVEIILPLALSILLLVVAIALPHAR